MLSARPSNALLLATIVMSLTSAACVDDDPVDPRTVVPQWTVANLPEDSIRDVPAMVEIAREVPSFGGVYFDDEGQLVIAMTDVTRSMHVERLLQSRLGSHQTKTGVKRGTTVRFATKAVE